MDKQIMISNRYNNGKVHNPIVFVFFFFKFTEPVVRLPSRSFRPLGAEHNFFVKSECTVDYSSEFIMQEVIDVVEWVVMFMLPLGNILILMVLCLDIKEPTRLNQVGSCCRQNKWFCYCDKNIDFR